MKNLFEATTLQEVKDRVSSLRPDSERQWGTMTVAQMVAHCSAGVEMAQGKIKPSRKLIGRILGPVIKPLAFRDDEPMRRNSPTVDELITVNQPDFTAEQAKLQNLIDCFAASGLPGCTDHPHAFFGRLTPKEWSILMYKHLDHHLRQFGA